MSDDESEVLYMRRTNANVLHYGSLEDRERARLQDASSSGSMAADAIQAGISAGNINISTGKICKVSFCLSEVKAINFFFQFAVCFIFV